MSIISRITNMFKRNRGSGVRISRDTRDPRITRIEFADAGPNIADMYAALRRHVDDEEKMAAMERALEAASIRLHEEHVSRMLADNDKESLLEIVEAFLHVQDDDADPLIAPIIDSDDLTDQESSLFDAAGVYFDFQENLKNEVDLYVQFKAFYLEKLKTLRAM